MNVDYKVFTTIIHKRLKTISEYSLMREQSGFRNRRSHMDNNFAAKQIAVKGTEHNFGTHITFIGFETHKK
jgi:hypothetical protein